MSCLPCLVGFVRCLSHVDISLPCTGVTIVYSTHQEDEEKRKTRKKSADRPDPTMYTVPCACRSPVHRDPSLLPQSHTFTLACRRAISSLRAEAAISSPPVRLERYVRPFIWSANNTHMDSARIGIYFVVDSRGKSVRESRKKICLHEGLSVTMLGTDRTGSNNTVIRILVQASCTKQRIEYGSNNCIIIIWSVNICG